MFSYIEGAVSELNPAVAVIDCSGVGYEIRISLYTYSKIKETARVRLWVHHVVREDAQLLFGFSDKAEKKLFLQLISVSGVGANTACMILSSLSPSETIKAIVQEDAKKIQSVKGIGLKTAQRIIVDLKDKVGKDEFISEIVEVAKGNLQREPALAALLMLGFSKQATEKALDKILDSEPELDVESLIKQALRML